MNKMVPVLIPVSPEAAELLGDAERASRIGRLVSDLLSPSDPATDPLAAVIASLKTEMRQVLSDAEIEAELATYNSHDRL